MIPIPPHIKIQDVSYTFVTRVPSFLSELEQNTNLMLMVKRNEANDFFLGKIHPTDHIFLFYKNKYLSLPSEAYTSTEAEIQEFYN